MPERFEIYVVYKWRYINTLPFPFSFTSVLLDLTVIMFRYSFA